MRLALLGDLHVGLFTRPSRLDQIFTTTASLNPEVVMIAGDMIDDDPYFVPKLLRGTRTLPATIPILAVFGNHEMYGAPECGHRPGCAAAASVCWSNEGFPLRDLWIAGVSDRAASQMPNLKHFTPDLAKALAGKPPNAIPIALSHQPTIIADARKHGVPLALCAHTHGGQLGFRPLRWSLAGVFLPYHMGLYDVPPTQLYVNTGTGYWLLPFRLGMTPEITLIELQAGEDLATALFDLQRRQFVPAGGADVDDGDRQPALRCALHEAEARPDRERRADDEHRVGFVDALHGVADFVARHRLAEEDDRRLEYAAAAIAFGDAKAADHALRYFRIAVRRKVRFVGLQAVPLGRGEPFRVEHRQPLLHLLARNLARGNRGRRRRGCVREAARRRGCRLPDADRRRSA